MEAGGGRDALVTQGSHRHVVRCKRDAGHPAAPLRAPTAHRQHIDCAPAAPLIFFSLDLMSICSFSKSNSVSITTSVSVCSSIESCDKAVTM